MAKKPKQSKAQKFAQEVEARESVDENEVASSGEGVVLSSERKASKEQRVKKRGRRYLKSKERISVKMLSIPEAIAKVRELNFASFDASVDVHLVVNELGIRGEVDLPFSNGKSARVKVVDETVLAELENSVISFDVLIATPQMMPQLMKFAKLLGPRGLMPNPKAGTLGSDIGEMVKRFSGNVIRFKTEPKAPLIHLTLGKLSQDNQQLQANLEAVLNAVGVKNVKAGYLASTMSPSVQILLQ